MIPSLELSQLEGTEPKAWQTLPKMCAQVAQLHAILSHTGESSLRTIGCDNVLVIIPCAFCPAIHAVPLSRLGRLANILSLKMLGESECGILHCTG